MLVKQHLGVFLCVRLLRIESSCAHLMHIWSDLWAGIFSVAMILTMGLNFRMALIRTEHPNKRHSESEDFSRSRVRVGRQRAGKNVL